MYSDATSFTNSWAEVSPVYYNVIMNGDLVAKEIHLVQF